jgi:hypothetical protein
MADNVDRIIAKGVPITLIDGTETTIRFGMLGTRMLTKKYGSLSKLQRAINELLGTAAESEDEKDITDDAMDLLLLLRAAGLSHLGMNEFELDDAVGQYGLMQQMSMIFEAFSEGLGDDSTAGPKDHQAKSGTRRSPSQHSGPTAPLKVAAATTSSGT